jgi:hypothetical protein
METIGGKFQPEATNAQTSTWWEITLVALPEVLKKGDRFLMGEVHPLRSKPEETHWVLKLEIAPGPTPPR